VTPPLTGACMVDGDKSISHRAAILGALARGTTVVHGWSRAGDCASTLEALHALGVEIGVRGGDVSIRGPLPASPRDLGAVDCGRAGTAMRLLTGVLASFPMTATLTGDPQLMRRPMGRLAEPLRAMGARIELLDEEHPPITIVGTGDLRAIDHVTTVASAQVKSAVLLAGLRADGRTMVREPAPSRDHTERMLGSMGASVGRAHPGAWVEPGELSAIEMTVPGDPSSAAFLWAAAALVRGSDLVVDGVGLNPTRTGFLRILGRMGGDVRVEPDPDQAGEPVGAVRVRYAPLTATTVDADEIPSTIDELPLVGLLATQAEGAAELRVKESDRVAGVVRGLRELGADLEEAGDGFVVRGPTPLRGGGVDALADHRLAMTFAVAGLLTPEPVHVEGLAYAGDSFPGFGPLLERLSAGARA
jgi:3-phosphoshikimate 1-carboxyvinyltransferase